MAEAYTDKKEEDSSSPVMTARARYEQLKSEREPFLRRARECAELTIPYLMPPEGSDGSTDLPTPFQSVGARGVTNLTAKLLLVLFPPGSAFFRLDIVQRLLDKIADEKAKGEFTAALSKIENEVRSRMEQKGTRTQLTEAIEQLVNSGNYLLQVLPDCGLKGHTLDHYVVKRDLSGNVAEIVAMESLSRQTAPPEVKALVETEPTDKQDSMGADRVDIYTWIKRSGKSWQIHQEVCGKQIPDSFSTQPLEKGAWIPLRWSAKAGEDYGRGFCEKHLGDLKSCDRLNRAILDFAAGASKVLLMVKPGGVTERKKVARAKNLEVIEGDARDLTFLQMEKFADFRVVKETKDQVEKRLEQAFLLLSGSQRDAERVTAEEIRLLAQELEAALGGTYSVLAQELQRPLVVRVLHQMQVSNDLPQLPDKAIVPQIVTGIAGLGRSSDLQRLDALLAGVGEIFGQAAVAEYASPGEYMKRRAAALSVDTAGLVRSEEEVQQSRAQAAQQDLAAKLAPKGMEMAAQAAQPQTEGVEQ